MDPNEFNNNDQDGGGFNPGHLNGMTGDDHSDYFDNFSNLSNTSSYPPANETTQLEHPQTGPDIFNATDSNPSGDAADAANILNDLRSGGAAPMAPMGHQYGGQYGGQQYGQQQYGGHQYEGQQQGGYRSGMQQQGYGNGRWMMPQQQPRHLQQLPHASPNFYVGNGHDTHSPNYNYPPPPTTLPHIPSHNGYPVNPPQTGRPSYQFGTDDSFGETGYRGSFGYDEEDKANNLNSVPLADRAASAPRVGMVPGDTMERRNHLMRLAAAEGMEPTGTMWGRNNVIRTNDTAFDPPSGDAAQGDGPPAGAHEDAVDSPPRDLPMRPAPKTGKGKGKGKGKARAVDDEDYDNGDEQPAPTGSPTTGSGFEGIDPTNARHPSLLGFNPSRKTSPKQPKKKAAPKSSAKKLSAGTPPTERRKLSPDQKKKNHRESEATRRRLNAQAFKQLQELVPSADDRHSVSEKMEEIANFVESMRTTNAALAGHLGVAGGVDGMMGTGLGMGMTAAGAGAPMGMGMGGLDQSLARRLARGSGQGGLRMHDTGVGNAGYQQDEDDDLQGSNNNDNRRPTARSTRARSSNQDQDQGAAYDPEIYSDPEGESD